MDSKKRQLTLDTDPVMAAASALVWILALLFVIAAVFVFWTRGFSHFGPRPPSHVGIEQLLSSNTYNLVLFAFFFYVCIDVVRSPLSSKGMRIGAGFWAAHNVLSGAELLVQVPKPLLWINYLLGIGLWIALLAAALIGIPLWFRSITRRV